MDHKDFYKLMAKYKFTLATENAVCDGYMTEKLWRPLMLGSVPIVLGSPRVKVIYSQGYLTILETIFSIDSKRKKSIR